jgi:hypothetical protein
LRISAVSRTALVAATMVDIKFRALRRNLNSNDERETEFRVRVRVRVL